MTLPTVVRSALALALLIGVAGNAQAAGDAAAGEKIFKGKCSACHVADDGKNKAGPYLKGVYDRKAGSVAEFKYSDGMKNSGLVWNDANLTSYLKDPKGFITGNKMAFLGLKDDQQVTDVIAYLKQQSGK